MNSWNVIPEPLQEEVNNQAQRQIENRRQELSKKKHDTPFWNQRVVPEIDISKASEPTRSEYRTVSSPKGGNFPDSFPKDLSDQEIFK